MKPSKIKLVYKSKSKIKERIENTFFAEKFCKYLFNKNTIQLKEFFYVILLNANNCVLGYSKLSEGQHGQCVVDIKHLCATAILSNSRRVIISHNHPGGMVKPSNSDLIITRKIKGALKLFDIDLMDHIIVSHKKTYSFEFHGKL
jgi:DNA repair protein RadC